MQVAFSQAAMGQALLELDSPVQRRHAHMQTECTQAGRKHIRKELAGTYQGLVSGASCMEVASPGGRKRSILSAVSASTSCHRHYRPLPTRSPKSGNSHLGSLGVKQNGSSCDDHKRRALSCEADAAGGHSTSGHSTGGHSTGGHSISGHSTSGHRMWQKSRYSGWNRATGQRSSAMT